MENIKDAMLQAIEAQACRRTGQLAGDLVRGQQEDKELVLAELDFQRWLAGSCAGCLR